MTTTGSHMSSQMPLQFSQTSELNVRKEFVGQTELISLELTAQRCMKSSGQSTLFVKTGTQKLTNQHEKSDLVV